MSDPITHRTLDLYARVDGTEYPLGQARVPIHMVFDPKAPTLREGITFTVGDPIIAGYEGFGEKAVKAGNALKQWRKDLEAELNAPTTDEAKANANGNAKS